jgi:quercetin dioxygenase-like cupin family protein
VEPGEVVLACRDLAQNQQFFASLGFRLDTVFPADDPREVTMSGFAMTLRLVRAAADGAACLRIRGDVRGGRTAPNGTTVTFVGADAAMAEAPATFAIGRARSAGEVMGRAGMRYRDLIPGRQAGALIASLIRIERGGPVPDYVHWHDVRTQVIHCRRGEVRIVYEDQGPPFVMREGDTVLQPPGIRHRVLECSDGLEVIEVSSPAEHVTHVDHELALPTAAVLPARSFHSQQFVWHRREGAAWRPWGDNGFEACETAIGTATGGAIDVRTVRATGADAVAASAATGIRTFWFVLRGSLSFSGDLTCALQQDDACVIPARMQLELRASRDLELLEVRS